MFAKLSKKQTIIKNFMAINISFLLLFAAFDSTSSVQPVLNQTASLGISSQMTVFGVQILTSLVIPNLITDAIGYKFGLALSEALLLCYVVVQLYPTWFTLIPGNLKNMPLIPEKLASSNRFKYQSNIESS